MTMRQSATKSNYSRKSIDSNDKKTLTEYLTNPENLPIEINPNEFLTEHGI